METNQRPLRIGVIGCGHVTERHHLPTLKAIPDAEVVAVADLDPKRLSLVADKFGVARRYDDHRKLLDDPKVEAVAVLVPPQFHVPVALDAIRAGKHLFVEKPLANALDGTDELLDTAEAAQSKSQIGFMLRSHRLVRQVRQLIKEGAIGQVQMIRTVWTGGPAHRITLPKWLDQRKAGGGVLIESGVHHYDMWRFLLDDEVTQVSAESLSQNSEEDAAVVNGRMAGGALATSVFSRGTADHHEIDIYGSDGRLRMSAYRVDGLQVFGLHDLTGGMKARLRGLVKGIKEFPRSYKISRAGGLFNEAYTNEWNSFLASARQNTPTVASLEDGRRALCVAVAAVESACQGEPVAIDKAYRRHAASSMAMAT